MSARSWTNQLRCLSIAFTRRRAAYSSAKSPVGRDSLGHAKRSPVTPNAFVAALPLFSFLRTRRVAEQCRATARQALRAFFGNVCLDITNLKEAETMGILGRLLGGESAPKEGQTTARQSGQSSDEQAIERYRYMLKDGAARNDRTSARRSFRATHAGTRRMVLEQFRAEAPATERAAVTQAGDNPQSLARIATRAEVRQPGTMERLFGRTAAARASAGCWRGACWAASRARLSEAWSPSNSLVIRPARM